MTIEDIDNKIKELDKKLAEEKTKKKGKKKKKINRRLIQYLSKEKTKLKLKKNHLKIGKKPHAEIQSMKVEWHEALFDDHLLAFRRSNRIFGPIRMDGSRKSFELIKPYFHRLNLPQLTVEMRGNKIQKVSNFDQIMNVMRLFKFKSMLVDFSLYTEEDIASSINSLSNKTTIDSTCLKSLSDYFDHLTKLHKTDLKIIPILESSQIDQDSFIFSHQGNNRLYLIWESSLQNKATYIFHVPNGKYIKTLIKVVKFILSPETNRMDLRKSFIVDNIYNIKCDLVYHNGFAEWKRKLNRY